MTRPALLLALLAAGVACSTPNVGERVDPIGPDRASFGPVGQLFSRRCGSLDCHGTPTKNLRIYGFGGLRLPRNGNVAHPYDTLNGQPLSTDEEIDATYRSLIGLEPEIMRQVVLDKGAHPERLTLVRKPRGTEDHDGNTLMVEGDPADRCLTTWLASAVDTAACATAFADDPRPIELRPNP